MAGKKFNLRDQTLQLFIVILAVLAGYFWLIQPIEEAKDVKVCGNYAYLLSGRDGLWIVDISAQPTELIDLPAIGHYDSPGSARRLSIQCAKKEGESSYVYLADGNRGLRIINVTDPRRPREIGVFDTDGNANDVAVDVGKNLAIVADGARGLLLIDVADPTKPQKKSEVKLSGNALLVTISGRYAYVADNNRKVQMVDISDVNKPDLTDYSYNAKESINDLIIIGNDLFLAVKDRGLVIVDWRIQAGPEELFVDKLGVRGLDVVGSYLYLALGKGGVQVWDVTSRRNPKKISANDKLGEVFAVAADGKYVYTASGLEGLKVASVDIEAVPKEVGQVSGEAEKVTVVTVNGEHIYMGGDKGLHILPIANPGVLQDPTIIPVGDGKPVVALAMEGDFAYVAVEGKGIFRISIENLAEREGRTPFPIADARGVVALGSYVYVAAGGEGLRVIDYTDPTMPREKGAARPCGKGEAKALMLQGNNLYVACSAGGIRLYDIKDRANPKELWTFSTPGEALSVYVAGGYAYVAMGEKGLCSVNLADNKQVLTGPPLILKNTLGQTVSALSVVIREQRAYVAIDSWGVARVDISNPAAMKPLGSYDTPGEAKNLFLNADRSRLYIADSARGLRIMDITNPDAWQPAGLFDPLLQTRAVDVAGKYAYILDGTGDLWVVDVTDPKNPTVVGYSDVWGEDARDIKVLGNFAYIAAGNEGLVVMDISNPIAPTMVSKYRAVLAEKTAQTPETYGRAVAVWVDDKTVYVADELIGLWIADVSDPTKIVEKGQHQIQGGALDVVFRDGYVFLAFGKDGLTIAKVQNPQQIVVNSHWSGESDRNVNIVAITLRGERAYLADQDEGLVILDISNLDSPSEVSFIPFPKVKDVVVVGNYAYLIMGIEGGGQVVDITDEKHPATLRTFDLLTLAMDLDLENEKTLYVADREKGLWIGEIETEMKIEKTARFITPGMMPFKKMAKSFLGQGEGKGEEDLMIKAGRAGWRVFLEIVVIGLGGTFIWLVFFAQFILPLNSIKDRFNITLRLLLSAVGRRVPAIFVENGNIKQREEEKDQRMLPGVLLLDTASGAVLRTATTFTRPIGPGVTFTRGGEFLAGTVDLHRKIFPFPFLGPKPTEDPFAPFDPKSKRETREQYDERQANRMVTSGKTRDGIEVVPRVSALFHLHTEPVEGGTRFGYDGESVRKAITREEITHVRSNSSEVVKQVHWYEIPAYLVVDVWREYLQKFTLAELFDSGTAKNKGLESQWPALPGRPTIGMTGFEIIKRMIRARLTEEKVVELNELGELIPGSKVESREYQLLQKMGVDIEFTVLGSLQFPPEVENLLVQNWFSEWGFRADLERQLVEQRRRLAEHEGRTSALQQFSQAAISLLSEELQNQPPPILELAYNLILLLQGVLNEMIRDKTLYSRLTYEERQLLDLIEWVRRQG